MKETSAAFRPSQGDIARRPLTYPLEFWPIDGPPLAARGEKASGQIAAPTDSAISDAITRLDSAMANERNIKHFFL
jgi:hypothetical protein